MILCDRVMMQKLHFDRRKTSSISIEHAVALAGPDDPCNRGLRENLLAESLVVECEDRRGLTELFDQYVHLLAPRLPVEFDLMEELITANWRMRRLWAMELDMMHQQMSLQTAPDPADRMTESFAFLSDTPKFKHLHQYEARLHRTYQRCLGKLLQLKKVS